MIELTIESLVIFTLAESTGRRAVSKTNKDNIVARKVSMIEDMGDFARGISNWNSPSGNPWNARKLILDNRAGRVYDGSITSDPSPDRMGR